MKINRIDLKKGFKGSLKDNAPLSRNKCPSINSIVKLCRSEISNKKKEKILDHVLDCYYCSSDIEIISKAIGFENEFCRIAREKHSVQDGITNKPKKKFNKTIFVNWKYQIVYFVLLALIFSFFLLPNFRSEKMVLRGFENIQIIQSLPIKSNNQLSTLRFFWKSCPKIEYYEVEIFDSNLSLFWESDKLFINILLPSQELKKELSTHEKYYWIVTAFCINGKKLESKLTEFSLID